MAIDNLVQGSIGVALTVTCKQDDSAVNISTFTTLQTIIIKAPDSKIHTLTASLVGGGTGGVITATTESSTLDQAGDYTLRAHIQSSSQDIYSREVPFSVESRP
jgi:hypothetical protein